MITVMRLGDATVAIRTRQGEPVFLERDGQLLLVCRDSADVVEVRVAGCVKEGRTWGDFYASITDPDQLVGAVAIHDDQSPTPLTLSHRDNDVLHRNSDKEWVSKR